MSDQPAERGIYSIGAVSRMLGVPVGSIRNWEDRYRLVRPERSPGGHRLYSRTDLERLTFVTDWIERGMSPAEAHRLLSEQLEHGETALASRPDAPRLLVLLAERDATAAAVCDHLLRTEGFEVDLALSADDARAKASEQAPALVVVELLISGGTGLALCAELADAGHPVLAVSPLAVREQAVAAGADAFLVKPIDPLTFVSAVKDLLGRSALVEVRSAQPA
jgi:DNA-binding transcriptional MerR regulator